MASSSEANMDLLVFKETFDFRSFVKKNLMDNSIYGSFDCDEVISQSAKILGQERNGTILMAWDAPVDGATKKVVTHIGMHSPLSPSHRTLYTHNEQVDICGASIDPDKSLLAFTLCEKQPVGLNYETFVAEISPCNRVFSLNISSPDFRKLQFVQEKGKQPISHHKSKRLSQLLVIIPDNWVCLYSFQLEPIEKGYTVVNQPCQTMVVKDLPWYQWDSQRQWLSYARFSLARQSPRKSDPSENMVIVHVVDFSSKTHNIVLTFSVPLPHDSTNYTTSSSYLSNALAFTLPVQELNMKVLHNEDGLWCVCLQHSNGSDDAAKAKKKNREVKIEYSVFILHNGHTIEGEVILQSPSPEGHYIQFLLLGNFVVAYVPGLMFHVLNVGPHTDPCHHLVMDKEYAPMLPTPPGDAIKFTSKHVLEDAVAKDFNVDGSYSVLDPQTCVFYDCSLDPRSLLELFMKTSNSHLKESLIHIMLVGLREYSCAVRMVEHICQTPLTLEDPRLFQEFLLAFSYSSMSTSNDCQKFFTRHLPLTNANCYRGNIYKTAEGRKYALLRCVEMLDFYKQLLVQSDQKLVSASPDVVLSFQPNPAEPLQDLCYSAVLNQSRIYRRLNLMEIALQVSALAMSTPPSGRKGVSKRTEKGNDSLSRSGNFVDKIKVFLHTPKSSHSNSLLSSSQLPFLLPDEDLSDFMSIRSDLYRGRMMQVLSTQLMLQSKNNQASLHSIVKHYLAEMGRASRILLHIIWNSLKFSNENHPLQASLHRQPSLEGEALFELLESYYLVHLDIGLQPPTGFMTLFICMGYLCLEPSVFVNYLRNGVFIPTKIFIDLLLSDCDGVDDDFLYEILSHIDEDTRLVAMKRWKNPVLELFLTKLPPQKQSSN